MCLACNMRCCAGFEDGGCGCVGGCSEARCDRVRDDAGDDDYDYVRDDGEDEQVMRLMARRRELVSIR